MGFIKQLLIGFIVFSFIMFGFFNFLGDMNSNYGQNKQLDENTTKYVDRVTKVTKNLEDSMDADHIAFGVPVVGDLISGGIIATNIFKVIIADIPSLAAEGASVGTSQFESTGLGWIKGFILAAVGILVVFAVIKFIMGREP